MISLKNIYKKFERKEVLHNINLEFEQAKISAILGPSGSGKTTLIRCINGLESSDSGQILFNQKKITKKNQSSYNKKIGMVFQNFNLFHHMNVLENLIYAPVSLKILSKEKAIEKADKILSDLGIGTKKDNMPSDLSGGQKQKVAVARSMMTNPEVIIFDEPTSALDPESIKDLVSIIEDLRKNITIIIVTHHLSFAKKLADQIIFMDQGKILCSQTTQDFFNNPASVRAKMFMESVGEYM
ncbi:MAG: amino acid ABC transporter ATP-binding protein [Rickettsiaceae bacterium]|nr:amino acid ABC transporter ATP-binding protein [Rickettsiaceae bacterium]